MLVVLSLFNWRQIFWLQISAIVYKSRLFIQNLKLVLPIA
ncbi:hypothetical protein B6N60_00365 [Richelia sinica FACHB-800]|uniref:Uncharacterized protein n=1 Tax=Richelia sinica FACHB-800 TaxID=1357546 RepID=A0A975Y321_9NOST|nr:hypothetical protein B6N60_00365 [Richelia sinica FACHB-800]